MKKQDYWDSYYSERDGLGKKVAPPQVPSQFAAFVLTELQDVDTRIVDFGCGNGRDAKFFARHGYSVLGVDESSAAIENCLANAHPNERFVCASVSDSGLADKVRAEMLSGPADITAYARFFIHAINEKTQAAFLASCKALVGTQGRAAFEFRTNRDASQTKVTPAHYRRFVNPMDFATAAVNAGFEVTYFVEGFGLAKYKDDDAHVARFILEPLKL